MITRDDYDPTQCDLPEREYVVTIQFILRVATYLTSTLFMLKNLSVYMIFHVTA